MLKTLFFGIALVVSAVVAIASIAFLAVLFLFTLPASPANAASYPVYLLEPTEEQPEDVVEDVDNVIVEEKETTENVDVIVKEKIEPVFLLEVVETNEKDVDLNSLTIPKLKELAKGKGIYIKSNLRKPQIIALLMGA